MGMKGYRLYTQCGPTDLFVIARDLEKAHTIATSLLRIMGADRGSTAFIEYCDASQVRPSAAWEFCGPPIKLDL
jgi:hypothetical protein